MTARRAAFADRALTNSDLLNPQEVAEWLQKPPRTLSQWRYLKIGPPYLKVGQSVRYRRADVTAWLDAQSRGGETG